MDVQVERGAWLDPRDADLALASWVDEFLALARRLSPTTVQTYRRDLNKYVLPRFGAYRIGKLENLSEYDRRRPMTPTGTNRICSAW
jgi:site-specific recombinase XerD